MKTITNEECIAKAPENLKDVVYPSDICANGRDIDPITNLEGDGCGVKFITHQVGLKLIIFIFFYFFKRVTVEVLFALVKFSLASLAKCLEKMVVAGPVVSPCMCEFLPIWTGSIKTKNLSCKLVGEKPAISLSL